MGETLLATKWENHKTKTNAFLEIMNFSPWEHIPHTVGNLTILHFWNYPVFMLFRLCPLLGANDLWPHPQNKMVHLNHFGASICHVHEQQQSTVSSLQVMCLQAIGVTHIHTHTNIYTYKETLSWMHWLRCLPLASEPNMCLLACCQMHAWKVENINHIYFNS